MYTPPTRIALHGFIAWPAASSMIFLISAASLFGGVWSLLAPGLGDESRIGERFTAIGILHLYQMALLAVGWLLCRWRGGNPDAIGIAILATCFAIGTAAGLDTIALDQPSTTLALGFISLPVLGAGGWWLARRVLGHCEWLFAVCAAILVLWHVMAPGWFGWSFTTHLTDVAHRDPQGEWLSGLAISITIAVSLLPAAMRFSPLGDAGSPFVRRAGMRWILILVLLLAGILHLLLLDHAFTLDRGLSSCLAPLAVCLLVLNELRHRTWGDSPRWDMVAVGGPVMSVIIATCLRPENAPAMSVLTMPATTAGLIATAAFGVTLSGKRARMADFGLGALLVALLTWNSGPQWTALHWNLFLLASPIAMTLVAIRHRRHEMVIGAIIVAAYGVVMLPNVVLY